MLKCFPAARISVPAASRYQGAEGGLRRSAKLAGREAWFRFPTGSAETHDSVASSKVQVISDSDRQKIRSSSGACERAMRTSAAVAPSWIQFAGADSRCGIVSAVA